MNVKEFIKSIQKNPKMFVDEVRIDYLDHLIVGFFVCLKGNNNAVDIDLQFHAHFTRWLVKWIQKNIDKKYEQKYFSWSQTLKDINITSDEIETVSYVISFLKKMRIKNFLIKQIVVTE